MKEDCPTAFALMTQGFVVEDSKLFDDVCGEAANHSLGLPDPSSRTRTPLTFPQQSRLYLEIHPRIMQPAGGRIWSWGDVLTAGRRDTFRVQLLTPRITHVSSVLVPIAAVFLCALVVVGGSWPTVPLRVRRLFAFGPAVVWGVAAVLGLGFPLVFLMRSQSLGTLLVVLGFADLGVWSTFQLVSACREASSDPLEPLFDRRPRFVAPARQPLTDAEQSLVRDWIDALESAGLLEGGEVTLSAVLDRCEHDDQCPFGPSNFLNALSGAKPEYAHLAFFYSGVEFSTEDAKGMVMQLARLVGRRVECVELEPAGPVREDRGQETSIAFDLDGRRQRMRFVMYAKALPWDLIEDVSRLLILEGDARRFEVAWSESIAMMTPISSEQKAKLEGLIGRDLFGETL